MKKVKLKDYKDNPFFNWMNNSKDPSDRGANIATFRHFLFLLAFGAMMFLLAVWILKM